MMDVTIHGVIQTFTYVLDCTRGGHKKFDWSDEQHTGMFDAGNRAKSIETLAMITVYVLAIMVGFLSASGFSRRKERPDTPCRSTFQAPSSCKVAYHPTSVMNTIAKILLFGASMAMVLSQASCQSTNTSDDGVSCVSIVDALLDMSPCYQVAYSFTMNGNTSIEANTVNVAVVVDGSGSISDYFSSTESSDSIYWSEWRKEKEFAKNIVIAFSERNLFENGGTASYVQFSSSVVSSASFTTLEDFIDFVDEDEHGSGDTNIDVGMFKANELLAENPSTATYMFVITDGEGYLNTAPADAAAAGTTVFAVGVGGSIPEETLLKITNGSDDAYFDVEDFDELDGTLDAILEDDRTSTVVCDASNVEIKVEFSAPIISANTNTEGTGGIAASISGRTVTFTADTLEESSTEFVTWLDACENAADDELITSLSYSDDEGNAPNMTFAETPRLSEYDLDFPEPSPSGTIAANIYSYVVISGFLVVSVGGILAPSAGGSLVGSTVNNGPGDSGVTVKSNATTNDTGSASVETTGGVGSGGSQTVSAAPINTVVPTGPVLVNGSGGGMEDRANKSSSKRRPSATLSFLLIKQLQFLAMLSLVQSIVSQYSWFGNFVRGLRWLNLWSPPDNEGPNLCNDDDVKISDLDAKVVVQNLVLIIAILVILLVAHIVVVSAIEAFWLTMKYVNAGLDKCSGETAKQLARRLKGGPGINGMYPSHGPLAKCRELSKSVWLYFPHIELVFLFYAFDGTVAVQVSGLTNRDCPEVFYPSVIALALYPFLMFVTTWHTIRVRVRPNDLLAFRDYDGTYYTKYMSETEGNSLLMKMLYSSWKRDGLFAWADKGEWEVKSIPNDEWLQSEWEWFQIGFEPMFADYTKSGTWFIVWSLAEWAATACVAVLVEESVQQLFFLLIIQVVLLLIMLCLRPFVNRVVNALETLVVVVNIITVAVELVAAVLYGENEQPEWVSLIESTLQIMVLVAVTVPVEFDTVVIIGRGVCASIGYLSDAIKNRWAEKTDDKKRRRMVLGYTLRKWVPGWFVMIGHNVVACVRDTWRGLTRSDKPGQHLSNDHSVDEASDRDWPNDDFGSPPSYEEMINGHRNTDHRVDGGHTSNLHPSRGELERKTSTSMYSRMPSVVWRGSMRVTETPFPLRGSRTSFHSTTSTSEGKYSLDAE